MINAAPRGVIVVDQNNLTLDQFLAVSRDSAPVQMTADGLFRKKIEQSEEMLKKAIDESIPVYGVSTGYGKSCGIRLTKEQVIEHHGASPIRFHGCGTGEPLSVEAVRAAMLCRLVCLSRGYSGVRLDLLRQLEAFLNHGITPVVPAEGSVGASGDLTPMSYVAAALSGEREVFYQGQRMPAARALQAAGLELYILGSKEGLAMLNGTAIMTGLAILAVERAKRIMESAIAATAMAVHALKGKASHFHPLIGQVKPHPGQIYIAKRLLSFLQTEEVMPDLESDMRENLQDPYSLRCAPQIIGVLYDTLVWVRQWVEIEANSANDNPVFDPETGQLLMNGNFYGGHLSFAMDALKTAVASVADLSDRQVVLLLDPLLNRGLPGDLVGVQGDFSVFHHGFKAMSLSASALAAEALKLTMPASSFSRSTESHNQDKVSMGTIAARDAERVCTLTERTVAIHLLAAAQGCDLRENMERRPALGKIMAEIRALSPPLIEDRVMDQEIERLAQTMAWGNLWESIP
ncbi:MAG: aromatic amino acid ammonia-lyase [Syntrophobacterales bacterium]|jgi:histidine ammonia-lyase|nr:aromatic amino acid ammonia-lyase [Syntrophobacterales bacterium]